MDGYARGSSLREAQPQGEALYLFAISGYALEGDRRRSAEAGFLHHFVKPVDTAELVRAIGELPVTARSGVEPRQDANVLHRAAP